MVPELNCQEEVEKDITCHQTYHKPVNSNLRANGNHTLKVPKTNCKTLGDSPCARVGTTLWNTLLGAI